MRSCRECGAEFEWERKPGQPGRTKIFCSQACSSRSRYTPRARTTSPEVRSIAASKAARARWVDASVEERAEAGRTRAAGRYTDEQRERAAKKRADLAARAETPCPYCGDPVGRAGRAKCSRRECHLAHQAAKMAAVRDINPAYGRAGYTEAAAASYHRRRALKRGATIEEFLNSEIFERDGWVCGICDEPVAREAKWPDPLSVSLDHIQPLSLGGEHSRANTRCSHLGCNVRRGNRVA